MSFRIFAISQEAGRGFLGTFDRWSLTIFPNSMQKFSLLLILSTPNANLTGVLAASCPMTVWGYLSYSSWELADDLPRLGIYNIFARIRRMTNYISTPFGNATHICIKVSGHHCFKYTLVAYRVPLSPRPKQWLIIIWIIRGIKNEWKSNSVTHISFKKERFTILFKHISPFVWASVC